MSVFLPPLQEAGFSSFNPADHPRDVLGQFRKKIAGLSPGESVRLPDGTTVRRSAAPAGGAFRVSWGPSSARREEPVDSAAGAASKALRQSSSYGPRGEFKPQGPAPPSSAQAGKPPPTTARQATAKLGVPGPAKAGGGLKKGAWMWSGGSLVQVTDPEPGKPGEVASHHEGRIAVKGGAGAMRIGAEGLTPAGEIKFKKTEPLGKNELSRHEVRHDGEHVMDVVQYVRSGDVMSGRIKVGSTQDKRWTAVEPGKQVHTIKASSDYSRHSALERYLSKRLKAKEAFLPPLAELTSGGVFAEGKHKRGKKGTPEGGRFVKSGSSGKEVRGVQAKLGGIKVDGAFGPKTQRAVRSFQKQNGLQVDGVVGRQTAAALLGREKKRSVGALTDQQKLRLSAWGKRG